MSINYNGKGNPKKITYNNAEVFQIIRAKDAKSMWCKPYKVMSLPTGGSLSAQGSFDLGGMLEPYNVMGAELPAGCSSCWAQVSVNPANGAAILFNFIYSGGGKVLPKTTTFTKTTEKGLTYIKAGSDPILICGSHISIETPYTYRDTAQTNWGRHTFEFTACDVGYGSARIRLILGFERLFEEIIGPTESQHRFNVFGFDVFNSNPNTNMSWTEKPTEDWNYVGGSKGTPTWSTGSTSSIHSMGMMLSGIKFTPNDGEDVYRQTSLEDNAPTRTNIWVGDTVYYGDTLYDIQNDQEITVGKIASSEFYWNDQTAATFPEPTYNSSESYISIDGGWPTALIGQGCTAKFYNASNSLMQTSTVGEVTSTLSIPAPSGWIYANLEHVFTTGSFYKNYTKTVNSGSVPSNFDAASLEGSYSSGSASFTLKIPASLRGYITEVACAITRYFTDNTRDYVTPTVSVSSTAASVPIYSYSASNLAGVYCVITMKGSGVQTRKELMVGTQGSGGGGGGNTNS